MGEEVLGFLVWCLVFGFSYHLLALIFYQKLKEKITYLEMVFYLFFIVDKLIRLFKFNVQHIIIKLQRTTFILIIFENFIDLFVVQ